MPKHEKGQIVDYDPIPTDLISKYLKQIEYLDKRLISEKWDENDELAFMDLEEFFVVYHENKKQSESAGQSPGEGILSKLNVPSREQAIGMVEGSPFIGRQAPPVGGTLPGERPLVMLSPGAKKKQTQQPQDRLGILEPLESR